MGVPEGTGGRGDRSGRKGGPDRRARRSSVPAVARRVYAVLPKGRRRRFWLLVVAMVGLAVLEMSALASIALFVSSLGNPEATLRGGVVGVLHRVTGWKFPETQVELVLGLSIAVVVLLAVKNMAALAIRYFGARFSAGVQAHIGALLFRRFLRAPYEWHLGRNSTALVQAVDWRQHFGIMVYRLLEGLSDFLVLTAIIVALVVNQTGVGLAVAGVLGALAMLVYRRVKRVLRANAARVRDLNRTGFHEVSSALQGVKEVRLSSAEGLFEGRFQALLDELILKIARQRALETTPGWILETAGFLVLATAIAMLVLVFRLDFPAVLATVSIVAVAAWRALPTLNRVIGASTQLRVALPFVETVLEYLDQVPAPAAEADSGEGDGLSLRDAVVVDKVRYRYPEGDRFALEEVSFSLRQGHATGLVGRSGAGKSTLADIIAGLLAPTSGRVLVDGQVLSADNSRRWIRSIGYVTQHPYMLDATLAENVAVGYGRDSIDQERVLRCCEMAGVDFLDELPEGIWSRLAERGARLSGGQRQRVAIARVLYRDPQLVILDEATSALDQRSERAIREAIRALRGRYTVLIIAHRLSSVEDCDEVVWLDAGKLREAGPQAVVLPHYVASVDEP